MRTAGLLQQDSPFTDLQLFFSATQSLNFTATTPSAAVPWTTFAGITAAGVVADAQVDTVAIAASTTALIKFNLNQLFIRTGMLAGPGSQQQFGTANGPGPNSTPGTSDPSGMGYGEIFNESTGILSVGSNTKAPVSSGLLPTLVGPLTNNIGGVGGNPNLGGTKGIRIKWIDMVYRVLGVPLTSAGISLYPYNFALGHDVASAVESVTSVPVALPSAALAINSATQKVHRERTTFLDVSTGVPPTFQFTDGTFIFALADIVTPSGSTANLAGIIVGCDYNFN